LASASLVHLAAEAEGRSVIFLDVPGKKPLM